jgi:FlaA1/EpsC-like NDP-sugar epimerase
MQPHTSMSLMEENPSQAILTNIEGTKIWLIYLASIKLKFVMVSTDKAVNPSNVMVLVKELPKNTCNLYNLKIKTQAKKQH